MDSVTFACFIGFSKNFYLFKLYSGLSISDEEKLWDFDFLDDLIKPSSIDDESSSTFIFLSVDYN